MIYKYFDTGIYKLIFFWSKNPLEVSEEFIRNYNSSQDLEDREKYEVTAHKMLERAKVEYHCAIKMVKLFKLVYDIGAKFQIFLTFYFFLEESWPSKMWHWSLCQSSYGLDWVSTACTM